MANTNPIYIVFNRQTGQVVPGFNGSVASIPNVFQSNLRDLKIQFVDPSGSNGFQASSAWVVANMGAFTLACYVSGQPLGVGGPAIVAQTLAGGFAYDAVNNWWTGQLDLTPVGVTNLIGGNPSAIAFLEFDVSLGGNVVVTTLNQVNILAVENKAGANNPLPAANYPTTAQANATYYPIAGRAGLPVTVVSPGGTVINIYANDDGTLDPQVGTA